MAELSLEHEGLMAHERSTMPGGLLDIMRRGVRIFDLSQPLEPGMPTSPNHPGFKMALMRRHGDMVRPDGGSASNEMFMMGGHVGTHVDALSHVSHNGLLHGGVEAEGAQRGGRFTVHGAETIPAMFCRGLLLDVAGAHGLDTLPGGHPIGPEDLAAAAARAGVTLERGDVVLVRTGWARNWHDAEAYIGHNSGVPGVTEEGATWLAERGVVATGADTTAYEHIPPGQGHRLLPAHRVLLVEHGIHIIEHLRLEDPAAAGVAEFLFVLAPLKIVGGTGAPVRPLAVVETSALA
ncbi:cyclase family protein [Streptosporangium sp. NPDC001681]|uniref:cyclase family protein n=1 Tax=Streptosporangium sp. NPDC001681 TaxID=3154395 RepID=UPI0033249915